MIYRQKN